MFKKPCYSRYEIQNVQSILCLAKSATYKVQAFGGQNSFRVSYQTVLSPNNKNFYRYIFHSLAYVLVQQSYSVEMGIHGEDESFFASE
jgi:hypothetical protein